MHHPTDEFLLQRIAAGDRTAFAALYDRHAPRLLALVRRWLNPHRGDAEDVLQEIFWQVWCHAGKYDCGRSPAEVWLVLLARSRSMDHLRRKRGERCSEASGEPAVTDAPERALEDQEMAQQVRAALAQLPDEQRTAIVLAFFSGFTYEQVAQRLAIPVGTAKTRIRLGMKRLRDLLGR